MSSSSMNDSVPTTCGDTYQEDWESYEFFVYGSAALWLVCTIVFLPNPTTAGNDNGTPTRHWRSWLVDGCRGVFFCLEPCRPLLDHDVTHVVGAAHRVHTGPAVVFLGIFGLLQLVPPIALVVGNTMLYPSCDCLDPEACRQCTFQIGSVPVGSCQGVATGVMILVSLASLAFLKRAIPALGAILLDNPTTTVTATMLDANPRAALRSKQAILSIGLLSFALISISSYNRMIDTIATSSSIQDKRYNETSATGGGDLDSDNNNNDDDDMDDFYNTTWPRLRKVLCGEGAPNLKLSSTLFQLARGEVFPNDSKVLKMGKKSWGLPSKTLKKFFSGEFGDSSVTQGYNQDGKRFTTVYVRIWKCGNNQIRSMEKKAYKHLNGTYTQTYLWKFFQVYNHEQRKHNVTQPCIYTAIRDPISHFLSGYNEVEFRQLGEYNNQSSKDWPKRSKPLPYHNLVPYSSDSPKLRKMRFRAFVEDLLLEDKIFASHYIYSHCFSMSRVLVTLAKYKAQLTGYISGLENITSVWPDFMAETCPNFLSRDTLPTLKIGGQHRSSFDRLGLYRAAKEVWAEAGPTSRALCLLHAFDYACFEQLPEGIPALCRSVYRKHADEIIGYGTEHYLNYSNPKQQGIYG